MNKKTKGLLTKAYSILTVFMLLTSNFMPLLYTLPSKAIAQESEVIPTEQVVEENTPEVVVEEVPVVEIPEEETPAPIVEEPKEEAPAPVPVVEQPKEETPIVEETVEPQVVEVTVADSGVGTLDTVVENVLYECNAASTVSCVTTDKADYSPVEKATLNGYAYEPNTIYSLIIYSNDAPAVYFETEVTTDDNGSFEYVYQLDGKYRPQYYVEVHGIETTQAEEIVKKVIAKSAFTDSPLICQNDVDGVNDEPGQKDLTKMCYDESALPTTLNVQWNWDDGAWPGGNTGDACALFDTDNDGKANYAFCTTVGQSPAVFLTRMLYSCNDTKSDRCAGKSLLNDYTPSVPGESSCGIAITATDPYASGDYSPNDTTADCDIVLAEISDTDPKLIDVCSYPSGEPNSDPSDCIIATSSPTTKLEVIKQLSPTNDSGQFNLSIGATTYATNVGHGGTTGEQVLLASNSGTTAYSFAETAGLNTSLSNYTSSVVCKDGNGTGSTISTTGTNPWTVNIAKDKDVVCTITNTLKQGTLIVNKVIVGSNESPTAFSYTVNGGSSVVFEADGSNSATVTPGSYTIVENNNPSYTTTYNNCTNLVVPSNGSATCTITNTLKPSYLTVVKTVTNDNGGNQNPDDFNLKVGNTSVLSGVKTQFPAGSYTVSETNLPGYLAGVWGTDCASNGSVTLVPGDDKTCTITNNDIAPTLTVVKNVVNDNGGNAVVGDFDVSMNSNELTFGAGNTVGSTTTYTSTPTVNANTQYTLSENTNYSGYTAGTWSCVDNSNQQSVSNPLILNEGQSVTCTISNNDVAPSLTVIKNVVNDNGGNAVVADFDVSMNSNELTFGAGNTVGSTTSYTSTPSVSSNTQYTLSEKTDVVGYIAGTWSCVDNNTQQSVSNPLSLNEGQNVTCTISNNDVAPSLTVIKKVLNDNGGNAVVGDFDISMNSSELTFGAGNTVGSTTTYTSTPNVSSNTQYTLTEKTDVSGYVAGTWSCVDNDTDQTVTNPLTLNEGQSVTCTISNSDVTPTLTVIKNVVNDNGGNAVVGDFDVSMNSNELTFGAGNTVVSTTTYTSTPDVDANTSYDLTEKTDVAGYVAGTWSCVDNDTDQTIANPVTLNEGQDVTCTITNNDVAPTLTVIKNVVNDDGGNAVVSDFDIEMNDSDLTFDSGIANGSTKTYTSNPNVSANTQYELTENDNFAGYVAGTWSCVDDNTDQTISNPITLNEGQSVTCTITNNDIKPGLTVIKNVVNDNGGNAEVTDFDIEMNDTDLSFDAGIVNGSTTTYTSNPSVNSNTEYELTENENVAGYVAGTWSCVDNDTDQTVTNPVTLGEGQNVVCTISNNDIAPTLTVIKEVVNDDGGNAVVANFEIKVNDNGLTFDAGTTVLDTTTYTSNPVVLANTQYTVSEKQDLSGYIAGDWSCIDNDTLQTVLNPFTLNEGQNVTCTVVNNDVAPSLTVIKNVVNDNGGNAVVEDFDISLDGEELEFGEGDVDSTTTTYTSTPSVIANEEYDLTENIDVEGYEAGTWTCVDGSRNQISIPFSLNEGQNVTCTITNNDEAPSLTVVKNVVNDNGGNAVVGDFDVSMNSNELTFGVGNTVVSTTTYTSTPDVDSNTQYELTENENVAGYFAGTWSCVNNGTQEPVSNPVTLNEGQDVTCTITNNDVAPKLTVVKTVVNDNGGSAVVDDFDISLDGEELEFGEGDVDDTTTTYTSTPEVLSNESYQLTENEDFQGYEAGTWVCTDDNTDAEVSIEEGLAEGQEVTCSITNNDIAPELTVVKNVVNDNGGTATVDDFDIQLNTGDENNNIKFNSGDEFGDTTSYTSTPEVLANTEYTLYEDTTVDYYQAGTWSCVDTQSEETVGELSEVDGQYNLELELGQKVECVITNDDIEPRLEIEKVNDAASDKEAGDQVRYTITVKVLDAAVHNLLVTDFLPNTFEFVTGSSEVKVGATTKVVSEPTYSDGTAQWNLETLGNLIPGDIVTISYLGLVTTDTDPGLYKDIAWAVADSGLENIIEEIIYEFSLAEHESPAQEYALATGAGALEACNEQDCGNFVGTEVNIVETNIEEAGVVLGTKIVELPNTGMNPIMLIASIISMITGIVLVLFSLGMNMKKSKKLANSVLALVIGVGVFVSLSSSTFAASSTILRVETPALNTNTVFNIGYTVSNLNNETVDVTCLVKKPGDLGFSTFGSVFTTPNGGASSECVVDNSVLSAGEGTYVFKVDTDKTDESSEYSVVYDTVKPGTPTNFSKTDVACTYDVAFKTASDGGQTAKVEIFRSTEKSFTADASTLVGTVVAGSNESKVFNNSKPNCDTTYFYAVRAVDVAGNTSDFVGDTIVVTQVVNVPGDNTNNNGGNAGNDNNGEVEGETDTSKPGDNDGDDNGEVKGDDDTDNPTDNPTDEQNQNGSNNNGSWTTILAWIGGILLGIIVVWQLVQRGVVQKVFQMIVRR